MDGCTAVAAAVLTTSSERQTQMKERKNRNNREVGEMKQEIKAATSQTDSSSSLLSL